MVFVSSDAPPTILCQQEKSDSLVDLLHDDVVVSALSFLDAPSLVKFQSTCRRFRDLPTEDLWRSLCDHRWQEWPMYSTNPSRWESMAPTWKGRYQWVENDFSRTELVPEELEQLEWHFNFLPDDMGSDRAVTQSAAYFHQHRVYLLKYLWMYPRLDYKLWTASEEFLAEDGRVEQEELLDVPVEALSQAVVCAGASSPRYSTKQCLQISDFPPHYVARTSLGGWIICNQNVVFYTTGRDRDAELPDQLDMHLRMFVFS